jgi:hypothetical protein
LQIEEKHATFQFVSVPDRVFTLEKDMLDVFRVYTLVAGQKLQVSHIFVQFRGGSFLFPKISLVELHTIDPHSSRLIVERLQP